MTTTRKTKADLELEIAKLRAEMAAARLKISRAQNAPSGDSAELRRAMARIAALEWHPKPPPRHAARWSPLDELPDWLATALDSVVPPGAAAAWSAWAQQGDNLSLAHAMKELHAWTCAAAMDKRP